MPQSQAIIAFGSLRRLLLSGELAPGTQLGEVALAARLGMSRTPVREALRRLQANGLVDEGWRGVVVPDLTPAEVAHAYELRGALEALTAEGAARRVATGEIAPVGLAALREHANRAAATAADGDVRESIAHNRAFHEAVAALAGNPETVAVLARLWDRIIVSTGHSLDPPMRPDAVAAEHGEILEAIEAGDPVTAAEAARAHVRATLATLRRVS